jgi:hypothetical protein
MINLKDNLAGTAIGVRFRNNFAIEDHFGSILDELLYNKSDSLLNYITFPNTSSDITSTQKKLHNPLTGDSVIINKNNIILDIKFSDKIPKEKSSELIEEFFKTVTQKIYKIVNIQGVNLIGVVHKYIIEDEVSANTLYKNFKDITFDDANSITINFTKKKILEESKIKKDINDYENIICTISMMNEKKNEYFFQVDYQHIFDPKLDSIVDIEYKKFIETVNNYNFSSINDWIKKYGQK